MSTTITTLGHMDKPVSITVTIAWDNVSVAKDGVVSPVILDWTYGRENHLALSVQKVADKAMGEFLRTFDNQNDT